MLRSLAKSAACGRRAADARPTCGRRNAADDERRNAFLAFITNAADARPTLRPTMNRPLKDTHSILRTLSKLC